MRHRHTHKHTHTNTHTQTPVDNVLIQELLPSTQIFHDLFVSLWLCEQAGVKSKLVRATMILACIFREISGSNIEQDMDCPD